MRLCILTLTALPLSYMSYDACYVIHKAFLHCLYLPLSVLTWLCRDIMKEHVVLDE